MWWSDGDNTGGDDSWFSAASSVKADDDQKSIEDDINAALNLQTARSLSEEELW